MTIEVRFRLYTDAVGVNQYAVLFAIDQKRQSDDHAEQWHRLAVELDKLKKKGIRALDVQEQKVSMKKKHDWELLMDDPETGITCYVCKDCGDQSLSQDREEYDEEGCTPKDGGEPKCEKCGTEIFSEDDGFCQTCYDREHPGG